MNKLRKEIIQAIKENGMIEKEFLLDYIKQNKVCPPDEKLRDSWYNNYLNNVMASVKDSEGKGKCSIIRAKRALKTWSVCPTVRTCAL